MGIPGNGGPLIEKQFLGYMYSTQHFVLHFIVNYDDRVKNAS